MAVIEKRASGSACPGEDPDLDAGAGRIIAFLSGSGGMAATQGAVAGGSAASGDVPGLHMAALMQRVVPQLKAMEESEARLSASGGRHCSGKSVSDEARASLTRLSEAVFSGLAEEGGDAAALAEQQGDCCTLQVVSIKWHKGRGPPPKKTSKRKQKRRHRDHWRLSFPTWHVSRTI